MNPVLQQIIHHFEVGQGVRWVRTAAIVLVLVAFAAFVDYRQFRNLARPEAMEAAQLARNLSRGEGYTTQFIRPLSIHLLEARARAQGQPGADAARLKGGHPDVSTPPVYPLCLAAYMRCFPFDYTKNITAASQVHVPDLRIAFFNQALLILLAALVYGLGRSLFDAQVGGLSAVALLGSELFWRLSTSGLPNLLLAVWVTALFWALVSIEQAPAAGQRGAVWHVAMAGGVGLLLAAAGLTVYAALWLVLPVFAFLATLAPGRRLLVVSVALLVFLAAVAPWLARNHSLSGHPFGTAGYAVFAGTRAFPEATLERSLDPATNPSLLSGCKGKLIDGVAAVWRDLPVLGGSWMGALFLVGLLVPFADPRRSRARWLVLAGLLILAIAQALARTHLSENAAGITSENLVPALFPVVAVFGAALFSLLLDQIPWTFEGARVLATGAFTLAVSASLWLGLLMPIRTRLSHPPFFPPYTQQFGAWMTTEEVAMSDIPWAVAWYGDRKCIWIPRWVSGAEAGEDFFAINDFRSPIAGLYLSPVTLDGRFFSDVYRGYRLQKQLESQDAARVDDKAATPPAGQGRRIGWGDLMMRALVDASLPGGFPLKSGFSDFLNDGHLVMMDRQRWGKTRSGGLGEKGGAGAGEANAEGRRP